MREYMNIVEQTLFESSPQLWHGSFSQDIQEFEAFGHFGTAQAALDRILDKDHKFGQKYDTAYFYPVNIDTSNSLVVKDVESMTVFEIVEQVVKNRNIPLDVRKQFKPLLSASWGQKTSVENSTAQILTTAGYTAISYINLWENRGSVSVMNLAPIPAVNHVEIPMTEIRDRTAAKRFG